MKVILPRNEDGSWNLLWVIGMLRRCEAVVQREADISDQDGGRRPLTDIKKLLKKGKPEQAWSQTRGFAVALARTKPSIGDALYRFVSAVEEYRFVVTPRQLTLLHDLLGYLHRSQHATKKEAENTFNSHSLRTAELGEAFNTILEMKTP